jgi:predicted Zn-dependent protease
MFLGGPEQALIALQRSYTLNPGLPWVHFYLAAAYGLTDKIEAAQASLAEAQRLSGDLTSVSRYRAISQMTDLTAQTLREKSIIRGLQLAGLPET